MTVQPEVFSNRLQRNRSVGRNVKRNQEQVLTGFYSTVYTEPRRSGDTRARKIPPHSRPRNTYPRSTVAPRDNRFVSQNERFGTPSRPVKRVATELRPGQRGRLRGRFAHRIRRRLTRHGRLPEKTPEGRGRRLLEALNSWLSADQPLRCGINRPPAALGRDSAARASRTSPADSSNRAASRRATAPHRGAFRFYPLRGGFWSGPAPLRAGLLFQTRRPTAIRLSVARAAALAAPVCSRR